MAVSGGDLLIELFQNCGVEYIFCSPGSEWVAVWENLLKRIEEGRGSPRYFNCRDEMLAVSIAQGYAEKTDRLPAVLLHAGVGVLHAAMAIRNAYYARVPMLIFSGESYEHLGDGEVGPQGGHWLGLLSDIISPSIMVKNYVKWSHSISKVDNMVDAVYRGSQIACTAPAGPVFISVTPELLQKSPPDVVVNPYPHIARLIPRSDDLREAARWLLKAKSPLIIVEQVGDKPGTVKILKELAECISAPVYEGFMPYPSGFPHNHPLFMGYDIAEAFGEADVVFVVNSAIPWYPPSAGPRNDAKIIVLDEDPRHENLPYWGYRFNLSIAADVEEGLAALLNIIKNEIGKQSGKANTYKNRGILWSSRHDAMVKRSEEEALAVKEDRPIAAPWFLYAARQVFPNETFVLDETVNPGRYVQKYLAEPGYYIKSAYGGLGVGIGEALGVKLATKNRLVVLITGDGAFNYNPVLAGLGFAQEYHVPIFIIIFNNSGYQGMKHGYRRLYTEGSEPLRKNYLGVDITPPPDYVKVVEAFGAYGEKLEDPAGIKAALKRALEQLAQGRVALLDVVVA